MKNKYTYESSGFPRELISGDLAYIDPICLDILWRRGFKTKDDILNFLRPSFSAVVNNTGVVDFDKAIAVLRQTITDRQKIIVYQD